MSSHTLPTNAQFADAVRLAWETRDDQALRTLFGRVPLWMLPHFDEWIRRPVYQLPFPDQHIAPEGLTFERTPWLLEAPGLIAALACHRKGQVRSAAIPLLAQFDTPLTLGLLLVRVNDWAAPVREQARVTLRAKLPSVTLPALLQVFPLVFRLMQKVRSPDPALVQEIVGLFLQGDGQRTLSAHYPALPQDVRRPLAQSLLGYRDSLPLPLLLLLAHDPLPVLRLAAVRQLPTGDLPSFLTDQDGAVRALALRRILPTLTQHQAAEQASSALLDPQGRVRLLAQYTLQQQHQDVRAAYLRLDSAALSEPQLRGWIAGLASVGHAEDAALIGPFLTHVSSRVRLEAMHAVGTLDPARYRPALMAGVLDTSAVSKAALRLMKKGGLLNSTALLALMLPQAPSMGIKRQVLRLALGLERFGAVSLLLRWRAGEAAELSGEIDALIVQLLDGFGRTYYTRPSADLLAQLEEASAHSGPELRQVMAAYRY